MVDLFISHTAQDARIAEQLAIALEQAGFSTWYYERDSVPGPSYLLQTGQAIEQCRAVLLIISPGSMQSHQVTKEVVRAHEEGKPFLPLLHGIAHIDFQMRQREWREALGSAASAIIPPEGIGSLMPRLVRGLTSLGIRPTAPAAPAATPIQPEGPLASAGSQEPTRTDAKRAGRRAVRADSIDGESGADHSELQSEECSVLSWYAPEDDAADVPDDPESGVLTATIQDISQSEIVADLTLPPKQADQKVAICFREPWHGKPVGKEIVLDFSKYPSSPVLYARLPGLKLDPALPGEPSVLLRVYRADLVAAIAQGVLFRREGAEAVTCEAIGYLTGGEFRQVIPAGTALPVKRSKRFVTTRDNQTKLSVAAVADGTRRRMLGKVTLQRLPQAAAGVVWVQATLRIDRDGRFTLIGKDLVSGRIDVAIAGWPKT